MDHVKLKGYGSMPSELNAIHKQKMGGEDQIHYNSLPSFSTIRLKILAPIFWVSKTKIGFSGKGVL